MRPILISAPIILLTLFLGGCWHATKNVSGKYDMQLLAELSNKANWKTYTEDGVKFPYPPFYVFEEDKVKIRESFDPSFFEKFKIYILTPQEQYKDKLPLLIVYNYAPTNTAALAEDQERFDKLAQKQPVDTCVDVAAGRRPADEVATGPRPADECEKSFIVNGRYIYMSYFISTENIGYSAPFHSDFTSSVGGQDRNSGRDVWATINLDSDSGGKEAWGEKTAEETWDEHKLRAIASGRGLNPINKAGSIISSIYQDQFANDASLLQ